MKKIMFNDRYGLTKAVLEGRKTMTRRIMNPYPMNFLCVEKLANGSIEVIQENDFAPRIKSRYKVGEIVAVAQSYHDVMMSLCGTSSMWIKIAASTSPYEPARTNKMFVKAELMPHQIRITSVRAERLQDITEWDAEREGICAVWDEGFVKGWTNKSDGKIYDDKIEAYAALIDKINGRGTWDSNPYAWVYDFELTDKPE